MECIEGKGFSQEHSKNVHKIKKKHPDKRSASEIEKQKKN